VLVGLAGAVLFASLFMPWFSTKDVILSLATPGGGAITFDKTPSAWRVFSVADIALAAIAVYLLAVAAAAVARGWRPSLWGRLALAVPVLAGLAFVILRIVDRPDVFAVLPPEVEGAYFRSTDLAMHLKYGAIVALAALVLATIVLLIASLRRPASTA
jgi:hypothetical protein